MTRQEQINELFEEIVQLIKFVEETKEVENE